ncbi:alpha/beta hydrolase [Sporichthya sp.]|uniref:alpha/beta hydrolase fold domain-containing protein n=1 Tax=Sporichthya sp. TaxID=65475 RepID=UPI0018287B89|nr:alpha/beta hydrolase [Sporichthya sp.]MBA3744055.1 alpha/beta hydrolase fold domain-containing protein [Sporichthya sp.]
MTALDASAAALLEAVNAAGRPPVELGTPDDAREAHAAGSTFLSGPGEPVVDVIDGQIDEVDVRVYRPEGAAPAAIIYAHGGGWVTGTLDTYDSLHRALANRAGVSVVAVGYGLAPDIAHPHAAGQVMKVIQASMTEGSPLALAGDSAGAHLVTLTASVAGRVGIPIKALGLIYPVVSPALDTPSWDELGTGYGLTRESMRWYWDQYRNPAATTALPVDLLDLDLSTLPPTLLLTAGFDPLRDEGLALGAAIEKAGVPVERLSWDGQMHGFVRSMAQIPESFDAISQVGAFLRARLLG